MSKLVSRIAPRSWGASDSGTISESAPTWVVGSQRPATCQPSESRAQSTTCCKQLDLLAPQVLRPALGDPGDPGRQPRDAQDVGRAPFEQVRELNRLGRARGVAAGAPLAPGTNLAVGAGPDIEGAGAGRAVERLVAGKRQQVDRRRPEVDRHDAGRLGRVDQEQRLGLADDRGDRLDRLHGPQHVRGVGHRDQRGLRRDRPLDRVGVDVAAVRTRRASG